VSISASFPHLFLSFLFPFLLFLFRMDFDKTSFSVDWYTPGDKFKRLSFPKSARISIDDLVPDSPLSICFSPVDGAVLRPRSYSFVDPSLEAPRGWSNSAPSSPPPDREQHAMCPQEGALDWRVLASPGMLSIADDCALCGVDLDVSCLDALDEQLLRSPIECFTELCWASAVRDEVTPVHQTRPRARSFKCDYERALSPPKEHPESFEHTRPLAARIMLPLDRLPHYISTPSFESYDAPMFQEKTRKPLAYVQDGLALPVQGVPVPRKKREQTLARSYEPHSQPSTPRHASRPNHTLRILSDAFTRSRRKSRH